MNKGKALKKLQKAKQEALANSTDIRVGRLELNEAMKASFRNHIEYGDFETCMIE